MFRIFLRSFCLRNLSLTSARRRRNPLRSWVLTIIKYLFFFSPIGALIIWIIVIACLFVQWNRTKSSGRTKFIFASPQITLIGTLIWAFGYILLLSCSNDLIDHTPLPYTKFYFQTYPFLYYSQMLVAFVSGILWVSAIISVQYQQRDGYYQIPWKIKTQLFFLDSLKIKLQSTFSPQMIFFMHKF